MKTFPKFSATIVRDKKSGTYHIRVSDKGPQRGGDGKTVDVIEVLYADSQEEAKEKALRFVKGYQP